MLVQSRDSSVFGLPQRRTLMNLILKRCVCLLRSCPSRICPRTDPYRIPRFVMPRDLTMETFLTYFDCFT